MKTKQASIKKQNIIVKDLKTRKNPKGGIFTMKSGNSFEARGGIDGIIKG